MSLAKWRFDALEKLWIAEVEGRLPFQSNARAFHKLAAEGLAERLEYARRERFGTLTFAGWQLTHAGRLAYCASCQLHEERNDGH